MSPHTPKSALAFLAALLLAPLAALHAAEQKPANRPNVIVILADDLGYADLSCYGSTFHESPNLDKLGAQGMRFTQAYSSSPYCSPSLDFTHGARRLARICPGPSNDPPHKEVARVKSALQLPITTPPLPRRHDMTKTLIVTLLLTSVASAQTPLFDGTTFTGWEGDMEKTWRIEDGAIVAGSSGQKQPHNSYLATTKSYADFELTLQWKIDSNDGFMNGGVPFRAERLPDGVREVSGYQADLGGGYDGVLYEWVRRKKPLARPTPEVLAKAQKPVGEWNHYRIRAEGPHIRLWLNDVLTADYEEKDPGIATSGVIGLQTHGGAMSIVRYKDIVITELPKTKTK